jgi:hypothetical protein
MTLEKSILVLFVLFMSYEPNDKGQQYAEQQHRGYGDEKFDVSAIDINISRESTQRQFAEPGPQKGGGDHQNTDIDECFLHNRNQSLSALLLFFTK